jgi:hypothetical protein
VCSEGQAFISPLNSHTHCTLQTRPVLLLAFALVVPLRFTRLAYFNYLSFVRLCTHTVRLRFAFLFLRLCTTSLEASIAYVAASWQRQHQKSVAASATHLEVEARTRNRKHDRSLACRNEAAKVCL